MKSEKMDEFGLIEKYLAPLATDKGAFSLTDDAAVFSPSEGHEVVLTKDAISEGIHFLPHTPPELIAKKLVRVNLSDIAAMGAEPKFYLIAGTLNSSVDEEWIKSFADGLREEQKEFGISLLGGDTIKHDGPITLSMTMIGEVKRGCALRRKGAKVGDDIYVSGNMGNAAFGLKILKNELRMEQNDAKKELIAKYHSPNPRIELGKSVMGVISASIDVSDGLLGDLRHICDCSGVGAMLYRDSIPILSSVKQLVEKQEELWELVYAGGDDYELLFTATVEKESRLREVSDNVGVKISKIGKITENEEIILLDSDNNPLLFSRLGHLHM